MFHVEHGDAVSGVPGWVGMENALPEWGGRAERPAVGKFVTVSCRPAQIRQQRPFWRRCWAAAARRYGAAVEPPSGALKM